MQPTMLEFLTTLRVLVQREKKPTFARDSKLDPRLTLMQYSKLLHVQGILENGIKLFKFIQLDLMMSSSLTWKSFVTAIARSPGMKKETVPSVQMEMVHTSA